MKQRIDEIFSMVPFAAAVLFLSLLPTAGIEAQQWTHLPGTAEYVHRIKVFTNPSVLVACGDNAPPFNEMLNANMEFFSGEGFRMSTDGGSTWSDRKLVGFSVRDIVRLPRSPQYWIASVVKPFTNTGGIVRSTDGGLTWLDVPENDNLRIEQFIVQDAMPPRILSAQVNTSSGFQISVDSAFTFQAPSDEPVQTRSIEISEADPSIIYMAGDGRGLPGVFMSRDSGATWSKDSLGLQGKRVLCVAPSRSFANVVYCGTDSASGQTSTGSGIFKSNDYGKTWVRLFGSELLRVWRIIEHPLAGDVLIAAADSAGVYMSGSFGGGWEPVNDGLPANRIVRTVELTADAHPPKFLTAVVGTYGHGLYRSRQITASVPSGTHSVPGTVAPQPLVGSGQIHVPVVTSAPAQVFNTAGTLVATLDVFMNTDTSTTWQLSSSMYAPGVYIARIRHQQGVSAVPFVVAPR
jgi:photosystem II stability/assembly factor-like uncharacterized protein